MRITDKASPTRSSTDVALALLATHPGSEPGFFLAACLALVKASGYRWAGVVLLDAKQGGARIIALTDGGRSIPGFAFALPGTPCGALYAGAPANGYSYFCDTPAESFPRFDVFGQGVARAYLGSCFRNDAGKTIGHVFVMDDTPRTDQADTRAFLALLAHRVGAEWVRQQSEARLRAVFECCRDGIIVTTADGALQDINPAALDMLKWDKASVTRQGLPDDLRAALVVAAASPATDVKFSHSRSDDTLMIIEITSSALRLDDQPCWQYFLRDVTARAAQEDLRRHYEAIMRHSRDFLALVDRNYRYLAVSLRYGEVFERDTCAIVGQSVQEIHGEPVFTDFIKPNFDRCLQGEDVFLQHPIECTSGSRMVDAHLIPCTDEQGRVVGVVINARDITESFHLSRKLAHQASHDDLTQLPNRRTFETRLTEALRRAQDGDGEHALCYVDLDQFKVVNDTVGHAAGDEFLKQVSVLLQSRLRGTDTIARLGGDEFGILLPDCTLEQARRILDELLSLLEGYRFRWENRTFQTTASMGVVPITTHALSVQQLLSSADIACYAAKDLGRNRVHIYEMQDADLLRRQRDLRFAGQLRTAVQEGRFELFHQPVVHLRDPGRGSAYDEVLVRMVDEQGELIQPGAFVGAAERYGLMRYADEWVIRTVLHKYDSLFARRGAPRVGINLSGASLADDSFLYFVRRELDASGLDPTKLCFEITETAAINSLVHAREFIFDMRKLGCRFALDDFGSGLSSFAYLKQFPVDYLKIDGVFVRSMEEDKLDRALVDAIGTVARALGIDAIAEHVETQGARTAVMEAGIEYAQGFLMAAPQRLSTSILSSL